MLVNHQHRNYIHCKVFTGTSVSQCILISGIPLWRPDTLWLFTIIIYKAQDQFLEKGVVYLPKPMFGHRQLYDTVTRAGS